MAQQSGGTDPRNLQQARYTEQRAPQFAGGGVDPQTGNVSDNPSTPAPPPQPAQPETRLGEMEAPSLGKVATDLAVSAGVPYVGAAVGSSVGGQVATGAGLGEAVSRTAGSISDVVTGGGSAVTGSLGSSIGGGLGAGVGSMVADAAMGGGNFFKNLTKKEVYQGGIGAAVGFTIGNMILPGIGGFVGSFAGKMFCHVAGTMIHMLDGPPKPIEQIRIGDRVSLGGAVIGRGEVLATEGLYEYKGTIVSGEHAVFEDGAWLRVKHSPRAVAIEGQSLVYPLVTANHLLVCEQYICADHAETEDYESGGTERLKQLNANVERNRWLNDAEFSLGAQWTRTQIEREAELRVA